MTRWPARRSKYNARKVEIDGLRFDSQKEARRYRELRLREMAGEIVMLECHPRYALVAVHDVASQRDLDIVPVGRYTPDFRYVTREGEVVIEDVKGVKTEAYRLRKRLFEANYYPLTVREL